MLINRNDIHQTHKIKMVDSRQTNCIFVGMASELVGLDQHRDLVKSCYTSIYRM